jgi:tetratricopeptide (TPR) repeat protein
LGLCHSKSADSRIAGCTKIIETTSQRDKKKLGDALDGRCWAYVEKEQYDLAIQDCRNSILLRPDYVYPYHNLGNAYLGLSRLNEALDTFTEAIKLKPNFKHALRGRAKVYKLLGQDANAIHDYETVLSIDQNDAEANQELSWLRSKSTPSSSQDNLINSEEKKPSEILETKKDNVINNDENIKSNEMPVPTKELETISNKAIDEGNIAQNNEISISFLSYIKGLIEIYNNQSYSSIKLILLVLSVLLVVFGFVFYTNRTSKFNYKKPNLKYSQANFKPTDTNLKSKDSDSKLSNYTVETSNELLASIECLERISRLKERNILNDQEIEILKKYMIN